MRRTAAEVAAAAVFELYPGVELLGGGPTSVGFFYEFVFPHPVHLHVIEEKMRQIVREKRAIRNLEMVPFSASELLRAKGLQARARELSGVGGLVEVIQMGDFYDLSSGEHLRNTFELAAFKITARILSEKRMEISGWCHHSKEELKQFLKRLDRYIPSIQIGEAMGLWRGNVWLDSGLKLREKLIQFLKKDWFEGACQISSPLGADLFEVHRSQHQAKVAEVCYKGHQSTEICVSFFKEMKSCLHLIGKTLTILGFDHSVAPTGFLVEDEIGGKQILVHVEQRRHGCMIVAYVERILDRMLEKNLWVKLENQ